MKVDKELHELREKCEKENDVDALCLIECLIHTQHKVTELEKMVDVMDDKIRTMKANENRLTKINCGECKSTNTNVYVDNISHFPVLECGDCGHMERWSK